MKSLKFILALIILFFQSHFLFCQIDSIYDQGVYRTYIIHLPVNYNVNNNYPLVLNLHGLNSSAAGQEIYSQFSSIADTANFIVVYPNAINGSWSMNGNTDVDFLTHLIDTIQQDFSTNSCLFATGMSMGGFMTYKLSCALQSQLTAVAVVSGNMSAALENSCTISGGLPVMHFHGTNDNIVNYNGTIGIPPVDTTIDWWVNQNKCSTTPIITPIPNTNVSDGSTVEKYYYGNGTNGSQVIFYKIYNGGHTWPGATPIPPFGNTNQDINASALIWNFFSGFCPSASSINEQTNDQRITAFPNPSNGHIAIYFPKKNPDQPIDLIIYNAVGQKVFNQQFKKQFSSISIDISGLSSGIYFSKGEIDGEAYVQKIVIRK